jgi:hypothetical protein
MEAVRFTFYQLLIQGSEVHMRPYIIIYPDMVEIHTYA